MLLVIYGIKIHITDLLCYCVKSNLFFIAHIATCGWQPALQHKGGEQVTADMKMRQRSRRCGVFAQYSRSLEKKKRASCTNTSRCQVGAARLSEPAHLLGLFPNMAKKTHGIRAGRDKSFSSKVPYRTKITSYLFGVSVLLMSCQKMSKKTTLYLLCSLHLPESVC